MGAPKKQRRKYETPKKPYDRSRLENERKIMQSFGLRRKNEIWRAESMLRTFRQRARKLQAQKDEANEKVLFDRLISMGLNCSSLDDILEIGLEDVMNRRLQTIVNKKGIANTSRQARQFIVHGHIMISGRKVVWPGYLVKKGEEELITVSPAMAKKVIAEEQKGEKK